MSETTCSVASLGRELPIATGTSTLTSAARAKQDELGVEKFHAWINVQYGMRIDWINACAWLEAQTEDVLKYYAPPQNGVDEYQYFCGISGTYSDASVESFSEMDALVGELTRQFGGAVVRWVFVFRELPQSQIDAENPNVRNWPYRAGGGEFRRPAALPWEAGNRLI